MTKEIQLWVNGAEYHAHVEPRMLLVHLLRDVLNLTGTKVGCQVGKCGACTVMLNGKAVKSCMVLGIQSDGSEILTVEGLASDGKMHEVQKAFWENHALQCGYCTPGMLMSSYALLSRRADIDDDDIRNALAGNLCTCTGYENIIKAVRQAAERTKGVSP